MSSSKFVRSWLLWFELKHIFRVLRPLTAGYEYETKLVWFHNIDYLEPRKCLHYCGDDPNLPFDVYLSTMRTTATGLPLLSLGISFLYIYITITELNRSILNDNGMLNYYSNREYFLNLSLTG